MRLQLVVRTAGIENASSVIKGFTSAQMVKSVRAVPALECFTIISTVVDSAGDCMEH